MTRLKQIEADLEYEVEAWGREYRRARKENNDREAYEAKIKLEYTIFILEEVVTGNIHKVPSSRKK